MSRSYQHTPIMGMAGHKGPAQKRFRSQENRAKRRKVNQNLQTEQYDSLPHEKEYGNEWASPRDGTQYYGLSDEENITKWMRR